MEIMERRKRSSNTNALSSLSELTAHGVARDEKEPAEQPAEKFAQKTIVRPDQPSLGEDYEDL